MPKSRRGNPRGSTSHTAEVMVFADYKCFVRWQEQPCRKRDADYYALKEQITQNILDFLEQHYPGVKDLGPAIIANFPSLLWFLVVGILLTGKNQSVAATVPHQD